MSYCVEYSPELKKQYPSAPKAGRKKPNRLLIWVVVITLSVWGLFGSGLLHNLIPGDPAVTTAAFSDLVNGIGEGEPVQEAVFAFCRDVIVNGK